MPFGQLDQGEKWNSRTSKIRMAGRKTCALEVSQTLRLREVALEASEAHRALTLQCISATAEGHFPICCSRRNVGGQSRSTSQILETRTASAADANLGRISCDRSRDPRAGV